MVQPKYSPEESLQRVKLMMNYDLSKTSVENKAMVSEQTNISAGYYDPNKQSELKRKDSILGDILDNQRIDKSVCRKNINDFYSAYEQRNSFKANPSAIEKAKKIVQACKDQHQGKFGPLGGKKFDQYLNVLSGGSGGPGVHGEDGKWRLR
jgi:hypothetical protein